MLPRPVAIPVLFLYTDWIWYFMLMNVSWAVINFTIVLLLNDHIFYRRFIKGTVFRRFEVQRHVEKMLLFNLGLDACYIFIGLYLKTLSFLPDTVMRKPALQMAVVLFFSVL